MPVKLAIGSTLSAVEVGPRSTQWEPKILVIAT